MEEGYCVYQHTVPNGKVYIGVTKNAPEERWRGGLGYADNLHFISDILDYGWRNIKHEILLTNLSKDEALLKEAELIEQNRSNEPSHGYNNILSYPKLMKEKTAKYGDLGAKYGELGADYGWLGVNTVANVNSAKPVRCVETGEVFPSMNAAARFLKTGSARLKKCLQTGQRCRGYHWEFVTNEQEDHRAG